MVVDPVPLYLLTGFLGSGKTTLLSALVRQEAFADTAVVVNELGDVGLDHALIATGEEASVVLLESGCICCSLTSSLEDTLEDLYYRRERGEIPCFARIVVETTGLADPEPIASALAGGLFISRHVRLAAILVTVDATAGDMQLARFDEARRQVAMADRIILTKLDLATTEQVATTQAAVAAMNPHAETIESRFGQVDPERLMTGATRLQACGDRHAPERSEHSHHHPAHPTHTDHEHIHAHGYLSVSVPVAGPISWSAYLRCVDNLKTGLADRLLRVKGFLRFEDGAVRSVQGVGQFFVHPAEPLHPVPDSILDHLVIIAQRTSTAELTRLAAPLSAAAGRHDEASPADPKPVA